MQWNFERNQDNLQRNQEDFTPKSWRKVRIQVIYKKGDREDAGSYRPICSLPVLYKLFATVLYARLAPSLHKIQTSDQGGFRPNHRTDDHLMVYRVLEQRCREWGVPLYISTVHFTKAFDRIKHSALWCSLHHYGVEPAYVRLLQRLYSQQEGTVLTDKESDVFPIKRGTKERDPLSSLLFNTVLQFSLEGDLKRWQENKKASDWATNKKTAWRIWDSLTTCCSFPFRWKNYVNFNVNSRPAPKPWVWESTQTRQKYSVTRTRWRQKRSQSTTSKLRSWRKETVHDILDRKSRSRSKKLKRSKTDWKQRGQRSTNIVKSLPRKITDYATDYVFSIWSSRQHWHTQVARGHYHKNMKEWSRPRNERCFALSYEQKRSNGQKRKKRKQSTTKKKKCARPTKKLKRAQIKILIKIKIVMCPSKKTLMKQLTPPKKKKIGLNTSKAVPKKLKNTWRKWTYRAGLKHTEDWSGEWLEESLPYLEKDGPKEFSTGTLG